MREKQGGFEPYLKPGLFVSVRAESKPEVAAVVSSVLEDVISLELVADGCAPDFQAGEPIRLRYWDQEVTAYHWSTEVGNVFPEQNRITLATQDAGTLQRRSSYRVMTPIPFSATVIESAQPELIGKHILHCKTQNLSVDGMLFQTELPLKTKDKLGLDLILAQTVDAVGWIIRSEPCGAGVNLVAVMFLTLEKEKQRHLVQLLGDLA